MSKSEDTAQLLIDAFKNNITINENEWIKVCAKHNITLTKDRAYTLEIMDLIYKVFNTKTLLNEYTVNKIVWELIKRAT